MTSKWEKSYSLKSSKVTTWFNELIMKITHVFVSNIFHSSSFVMVVANYNICDSSLPPAFCVLPNEGWVLDI